MVGYLILIILWLAFIVFELFNIEQKVSDTMRKINKILGEEDEE